MPVEGRSLSSRPTQDVARDLEIGQPSNSEECSESQSAVELMGNDSLKVIAHELLVSLKGSVTVDWSHRESARARMRVVVKRILRKYGYPPDLQDAAVQTVLRQAEALSAQWAL